ncbi:diguanylate cyclase (GGDEF)-like protein [Pseudomonas sp. JUb42]|nr:diguanylate cyclase (GGDEF)-like protein [Pseudomonas sp. JUb42]
MSTPRGRLIVNTRQSLILQRFAMAALTYVVVLALTWLAICTGDLAQPLPVALVSSSLVLVSQLALLAVFVSGWNQRFADPSLTEFQVLLAIAWLTWLLAWLDGSRGTFLALYAPILLFGLFQLDARVFARCAVIVFLCFLGINAREWLMLPSPAPFGHVLVQICVLFVMLAWLSVFAGYVQAQRGRMRQRRYALQAHQDTLRGMMRQLEEVAATDELTNLYNRRYFLRMASRELHGMHEEQTHGLALIDLDHFKRINDAYGHAVGDRVLQTFATVTQGSLRESDILARYGGEEFVMLIPRCSQQQLSECCERVRLVFAEVELEGLLDVELSLSVGMTLLQWGDDLDTALQRADQALYQAKRDGRNRCVAGWDQVNA